MSKAKRAILILPPEIVDRIFSELDKLYGDKATKLVLCSQFFNG